VANIFFIQPVEVGVIRASPVSFGINVYWAIPVEGKDIIRQDMLEKGNGLFPRIWKNGPCAKYQKAPQFPRPQMLFDNARLV